MVTWFHNSTIWHHNSSSRKVILVPWQLSTGSIHDYLFCYCPLVGILFEVLRIISYPRHLYPSLWDTLVKLGFIVLLWFRSMNDHLVFYFRVKSNRTIVNIIIIIAWQYLMQTPYNSAVSVQEIQKTF